MFSEKIHPKKKNKIFMIGVKFSLNAPIYNLTVKKCNIL